MSDCVSEIPQTKVLVEEMLSDAENAELDVSDIEDLFDDLSTLITRQRNEAKKHKDSKNK